jgi:hypothetical protein
MEIDTIIVKKWGMMGGKKSTWKKYLKVANIQSAKIYFVYDKKYSRNY